MIKKLSQIFFIFLLILGSTNITNAERENEENLSFSDYINSYEIEYKREFLLGEEAQIDLTSFSNDLKNNFSDKNLVFEWNNGSNITSGAFFKNTYRKFGTKGVGLNIYEQNSNNKNLVFSQNFNLFIYEKTIPVIISKEIEEIALNDYIESYKPLGIHLDVLGYLSKSELDIYSVMTKLDEFKQQKGEKSDYLMLWGDRDFSFDILSKLNREITISNRQEILNIYILSNFNVDILSPYLGNFLANKIWINKLIITNEQSRFKVTSDSIKLNNVIKNLQESMFDYRDVDLKGKGISNFLFISKFVNTFSNRGFDTDSIYIILLIPFMLAFISFFKHLVGLSPMGIIPPMFLMILSIKLGIFLSFGFFVSLVILNLLILRFSGRFNMLYTPKVSILISSNLILFIMTLGLLLDGNLITLNITDSLYLLLFIVISERFLSIIVSKEFSYYRKTLLNTFIIGLLGYLLFNLPGLKTFILAYPEIMIIMLPILFMIGRFTGLRITEYFRFREVIKTIEEEE